MINWAVHSGAGMEMERGENGKRANGEQGDVESVIEVQHIQGAFVCLCACVVQTCVYVCWRSWVVDVDVGHWALGVGELLLCMLSLLASKERKKCDRGVRVCSL